MTVIGSVAVLVLSGLAAAFIPANLQILETLCVLYGESCGATL